MLYAADAIRADLPAIRVLDGWSQGHHLMYGDRGGVPVRVLDVATAVERQESHEQRNRTLALVPAEGLPEFDLQPRSTATRLLAFAGVAGVTFEPTSAPDPVAAGEVSRFGRLFRLMTCDDVPTGVFAIDLAPGVEDSERTLRRFFTAELMRAFNRYAGYSAQVSAGTLAVWRGESILPCASAASCSTPLCRCAALCRAADVRQSGYVVCERPGTDFESQARGAGTR